MSAVIFDCTELYQNPVRTGIQRVVRELLRHWPPDGPDLHAARFDPTRGLVRLAKQTIRLLADWKSDTAGLSYAELVRRLRESADEPAGASLPGDAVVFIPELFYDPLRCQFHERRLSKRPGSLALLAYDFLPYLRPWLFCVRTSAPLMAYLRLVRFAPHVAYISKQTREDHIGRVLRGRVGARGPVLPLGADGLRLEHQVWRPERQGFVALGSIDGRKNQDVIAAAFIRLWRAGHDIPLVIIGRAFDGLDLGWLREASQFPQFRWLSAASDQDVREELQRSLATIYVSGVEGFGLPPVESLAVGIPVITLGSIPSVAMLPSVGQIRLHAVQPDLIADAVLKLMQDETAARLWAEAADLRLGSWRDFAEATSAWLADLPSVA